MSKSEWNTKPCGCVKTSLSRAGRVVIRCPKHRGNPSKGGRKVCYFDDAGRIVAE